MSTDPASGKLWAMASHVDQDKSFGLQDLKHEWLFLSQGGLANKRGVSLAKQSGLLQTESDRDGLMDCGQDRTAT